MMKRAISLANGKRLQAVENLGLLYTPAEDRFDRIVRTAVRAFGCKAVGISLIGIESEWFKSKQGLERSEWPLSHSPSASVLISEKGIRWIEDLRSCEEEGGAQFISAEDSVFYAGIALHGPKGYRVGVLSLWDDQARGETEDDRQLLTDLRGWAECELKNTTLNQGYLELNKRLNSSRRKALIDPLTQTWNRRGGKKILALEVRRARRMGEELGVLALDVDYFKRINDQQGHAVGDEVLKRLTSRIRRVVRSGDTLSRFGGEEFVLLAPGCRLEQAFRMAEKVRASIARTPLKTKQGAISVTISIGVSTYRPDAGYTPDDVLELADQALYAAKHAGRNCCMSRPTDTSHGERFEDL